MRRSAAIAGVIAFGLGVCGSEAGAYFASGHAEFVWGVTPDRVWQSSQSHSLAAIGNDTYFTTLDGYSRLEHYNPDFASAAQCAASTPPNAILTGARKYGCRYSTTDNMDLVFVATPVADEGAVVRASGSVVITDTSLTGTLTVSGPATDEPVGATTTFSQRGTRLSDSVGNGTNGYNYRSGDGLPFGNVWYGITTAATLTLNLTGVFTSTSWQITGGTARFVDPGFACQQGGFSGSVGDPTAGILCSRSTSAGGFSADGGHLGWGWDLDGGGTASSAMSGLQVRDASGATVLGMIGGARADSVYNHLIPFDPYLDTAEVGVFGLTGEFRRGLGSSGLGCAASLRWDGTSLNCGALVAGRFGACITALYTAEPLPDGIPDCDPLAMAMIEPGVVPVPPALWLLGSAVALLGGVRHVRQRAGPAG
jgi:hypothetical protein